MLFTLKVNCLSEVCKMGGIPADDEFPDQSKGNQWWRFFIPLIFHMGIIHLLIIMMIQLYIGIKIERTAGWLRVSLIYFISGIGGNLVCKPHKYPWILHIAVNVRKSDIFLNIFP